MKNCLLLVLFSIISFPVIAQIEYKGSLYENSVYANAPEEIKNTKPFMREAWFYEQRAYPEAVIPPDAYTNSLMQRSELRRQNSGKLVNINWVSLGPSPGAYFSWGNISSRTVAGAFHPTNPDIIYIGPANGGIWKSIDGGINWDPLTDNEESLANGSIVIDPVNPEIVYAGTGEATYSAASYYGRGLLKSTNGGSTWQQITNGLPFSSRFSRLKIRPNHSSELLAAMGNGGLCRSTDAGLSWFVVRSGRVDDVVFSPTGDSAFAVGSGIGILRSTDGGSSFQSFGSGLISGTRTQFDLCKISPNVMYAAVFGSGTTRLFKTTNYGAVWNELPTDTEFQNWGYQSWYDLYCRVNPKNPDKAYVGTVDIFRTNDGTNFVNISNGYNGGNVHVDQHYLFFHPNDENTFFVCNDGGIWKTTNNGDSFTNMNQDLTLTQFYRIKASPFDAGRILGGTQDNGTQQTFSTLNWAAAFSGDGGEVSFNPFDENYIIGETQYNGLNRTTNGGASWTYATNGINTSENAAWVAPILSHPTESGVFFTARQRVYKSTNNGSNWIVISSNINGTSPVREMAISNSNPLYLFATSGRYPYLSIDGGANWTLKGDGLPDKTITSIYFHPDNENEAYVTFSGFGTQKVFKTTNSGESWTSISGNLPDSPVNDIFIYTENSVNPNTFFVATDIGVFLTTDNGDNWIELDSGIPNTVIMHLDYSPDSKMLRAGTHGRGVYEAFIDFTVPVELVSFTSDRTGNKVNLKWQTATETNNYGFEIERKLKNQNWVRVGFVEGSGTSTENHHYNFVDDFSKLPYEGGVLYRLKQIDYNGTFEYSEQLFVDVTYVPDKFTISQNYPNPFNPATTIKYSLPGESKVHIAVYNAIGQEVDELVSEIQSDGLHFITWDATGFVSGIYFYSFAATNLTTGENIVEMKKIILMK